MTLSIVQQCSIHRPWGKGHKQKGPTWDLIAKAVGGSRQSVQANANAIFEKYYKLKSVQTPYDENDTTGTTSMSNDETRIWGAIEPLLDEYAQFLASQVSYACV